MRTFKKLFYTFIFFATVIGAFGIMHNFASADLGGRALDHGYFYNNNVAAICGPGGTNCAYGQVIAGGFPNPASFDTGTNGNAGKTNFINFIKGKLNGGGRDGVGAAFIINTMIGLNGPGAGSTAASLSQTNPATGNTYLQDWENAINQSAVTINYVLSYPYSVNSGYQKGYNDDAFFSEGGPHAAVIFYYNGTPVYALKDNCGNPVGSLPGIQVPTDPPPQGNVDTYCTTIQGWAFDKSVPTQAIFVDIYVNGSPWRRITANGSRPDVGAANPGVGNNHGFSVAWDTSRYPLTTTYTVKVYAIGIDKSGNLNNDNPQIGTTGTVSSSCSPGGGGTPVACPMQPGVDATKVAVTLTPQTGNTTTVSADGKTKTVRYVTGYNITSVQDTNTGANLNYTPSSPIGGTGPVTIYVDFSPSVQAFPYDPNQVTVTYTTNYASNTYPLLPDGSWSPTPNGSGPSSGSAPWGPFTANGSIGECYPIHFNVDTATANSTSLDNYENPSKASQAGTITVHLWGDKGGSKRGTLSVNGLGDSVSYTIRHPDGSTYPLSASTSVNTSCGGSTTINCEGTASPVVSVNDRVGNAASQLRPGDIVCATFTISPQRGDANSDGTIQNGQAGTAAPSGQITSSSVCSSPVVNEPYFKVFGGDISAGNTFEVVNGAASSCQASAASTSAGVYGWNANSDSAYAPNPYTGDASDAYAGAGAQYSLMALNTIKGVASDQNNPNASPATSGNTVGLSFANTGTSPSGNVFATDFGTPPPCIPDYYADKPTGSGISNLTGPITITPSYNGSYNLAGTTTINGGHLDTGKHVVIYATGTVNITSNICFTRSGCDDNTASYSSINDIPSFVLVVKGNINISNNVTQLDGIYIAEPTDPTSPSNGVLSDCSEASSAASPNNNWFNACYNQLVVNGSFIANNIELLRTGPSEGGDPYHENASLRAAHPNETDSTSGTVTVAANSSLRCANGGVPDTNGYCGAAQYHGGSTSYGPWSGWSADSQGCGITYGANGGNTDTQQFTYVSGKCASGYAKRTRSKSTSSSYYTCTAPDTVAGNKCKATVSYSCPDGSSPDASHNCTITTTATHAGEIFNYNPAFWLTLSLQNAASQNALKYDAITSLPPVL
ncbi:MAG TPA: hypothetical protein VHD60_01155 [Candidatus Saccharimonadales bacterium]|nr:hypothetical protein [Candidatus Saccharimonadales bacterium]